MKNLKALIVLYFKGIAMGAADVVPGVSGGTIAFITGIYEELLSSIKSVDGKAISLLFQFKIKEFWQHINATFLVVLLAGIGTALFSLAKLLEFLLENYPILLWSFFFGLIIASALVIAQKITRWQMSTVFSLILGAAFGYVITIVSPTETPESFLFVFLSGSIAICAMILPGISGSFILVLLGKYKFILTALSNLDIVTLLTFMAGALVGILSFARLVSWLFKKYHNLTIAFLTGLIIGSLNKIWPWKEVLETFEKPDGEIIPVKEQNILPWTYEQITGNESFLLIAIILMLVGFAFVYFLEKFAGKNTAKV